MIGGDSTTSTGHAKEHTTRAPANPSAGSSGRNRLGGSATVATAAAKDSVTRAAGPSSRGGATKNPIGGGTTSTAQVGQHVNRPSAGSLKRYQ